LIRDLVGVSPGVPCPKSLINGEITLVLGDGRRVGCGAAHPL